MEYNVNAGHRALATDQGAGSGGNFVRSSTLGASGTRSVTGAEHEECSAVLRAGYYASSEKFRVLLVYTLVRQTPG